MGKLTGIITGLATVSILGFFVFSQYFSPLLNWLTPFFGPVLYIIFGMLFFLFANPLSFPALILFEIGIGILIGVSARKGSRAVGAAISVYTLCWLIVLLSVFYLATETGILSSGSSSGLSGLVTAIPPGTNLATIMSEPVLRRIPLLLSSLTSGLSSGNGSVGVSGVISQLMPLIVPAIINFIAFVVSAGVFGLIVGMLLKRKPARPVVAPEREKNTPAALIILIVLVLIVPAAMIGQAQMNNSNTPVYSDMQQAYVKSFTSSVLYGMSGQGPLSDFPFTGESSLYMPYATTSANSSEMAGYLISRNGTLYSAYAFFDPATASSNAFSNLSGYSGLDFAVGLQMASPENLFYGLGFSTGNSSSSGVSMSTIMNLVPPELLALGFSSNVSASQAQKLANSYFKLMGISSNVLIMAFSGSSFAGVNLPFSGNIYLYGATAAFSTIASRMAGNYTNRFYAGGLMDLYNSQLRSGFIVPGSHSDPVGGTVIVSGFMNSSSVSQMFSIGDLNQTGLIPNGTTNFLFSFSANDFAYNFREKNIPLRLSDFTGTNDSFSFSNSGASMLVALYPGNGTSSNASMNVSIPGILGYNGLFYTDNLALTNATGFNTSMPTQGLVPPGYTFSPGTSIGNITVNLTGEVSQSVSLAALSSKSLGISVTIYDNSSLPIYNVRSELSPGVDYGNAITIVSGSMNQTIASIDAGSSYSYNVTVSVNNSGTYYLGPSLIVYTYNGSTYSRYSQSASVKVGSASYLQTYTAVFNSVVERFIGPNFVNIPGTSIPLFLVLISLIIVGDVYIEYRALKRWLKR